MIIRTRKSKNKDKFKSESKKFDELSYENGLTNTISLIKSVNGTKSKSKTNNSYSEEKVIDSIHYRIYEEEFKLKQCIEIQKTLNELDVNFEQRVSFKDLKGLIDFYIPEKKIVLIYHGNYFPNSLKKIEEKLSRDKAVRNFLEEKNIKIIPVTEKRMIRLRAYLVEKLFNNKLPVY